MSLPIGKFMLGAVALGVLTLLFMPPVVLSHRTFVNKEAAARVRAEERRREIDLDAQKKPIIDLAMQGDYASALTQFKALESEGLRQHVFKDEILCLIHLHRGEEGLAQVRAASDEDLGEDLRIRYGVALAVIAHDEPALKEFLTLRVRYQRIADGVIPPQDTLQASQAPVEDSEIRAPTRLMKIACEFGDERDREVFRLLGEEAIHRGCDDPKLLFGYADQLWRNGYFRDALAWFRQLAESDDSQVRADSKREVYDCENGIAQLTKDQGIEAAERHCAERNRDEFFRRLW